MRVSAATSHLLAVLAGLLFLDAALDAALAAVLPPLAQQTAAALSAPDSAVFNAPSAAVASPDGLASLSASPLLPSQTTATTAGVGEHGASRTDGSSTISTVPTISAAVSVLPGIISSDNALLYDDTLAQGGLPLRPEITPGWSVAGVLLMLSGSAYALVGIKSRWLHCFFSTAFLASLGVTVLLVYVMNPPVSKGLEGAYIAAAAGSGVILGSVSFIFQDNLGCLACLLGGFCLCMWTLTLKPGGLFGSGGDGTIIFISLLSAASLAAFFSRWTRTYFMIGCISISGATATVLGIDCFSRAGLKEYWAYIWGLSDRIFPLDIATYPLTRGIRVEQAALVIIFFGGIMSQLKVWKLIKERRARKDAARLEKEAALQRDNLEAGRVIEDQNAVERREWDAVHGDMLQQTAPSVQTAQTASIHDAAMEKQSVVNVTARIPTPVIAHDQLELAELGYDLQHHSPVLSSCRTAAEVVMSKGARDAIVTVHVAEDLEAPLSPASERDYAGHDTPPQDGGKTSPFAASPEIIPLPFNVPNMDDHDDGASASQSDDDSSSILVNAEPRNDSQAPGISRSCTSSSAKRLSADSVNLRRISEDSISHGKQSKTEARDPCMKTEEATFTVHGDRDSIAATFDNESSVGDRFTYCSDSDHDLSTGPARQTGDESSNQEKKVFLRVGQSTFANVSDNTFDSTLAIKAIDWAGVRATTPETQAADPGQAAHDGGGEMTAGPCKPMPFETVAPPVFLTKEHLPTALSRVALSYRTNEWAKHLSHAEAPAPDELVLPSIHEQSSHTANEPAAPLNVAALRQTATTATVVPAMPRSTQAVSRSSSSPRSARGGRASRRSSSLLEVSSVPKNISPLPSPILDAKRASLKHASMGSHNPSRKDLVRRESKQGASRTIAVGRPGNTPLLTSTAEMSGAMPAMAAPAPTSTPTPVSQRPVPGVVSYDSPQTLIGQRAMLMRAKTHALNAETLRGSPIPLAMLSPAATKTPHSVLRRRASETYQRSPDTNASSQVVGSSGLPSISRVNSYGSIHGGGGRGGAAGRDLFQAIDSSKPPPAHRRINVPSMSPRQQQQQQQQPPPPPPPQVGSRQSHQSSRRRSSGAATSVAPQAGFYAQANYYHSQNMASGNGGYFRQRQLQQQPQPQQQLYHPIASQSNSHLIHSVYGIPGTSMNNSLHPHQMQVSDPAIGRNLELQRQFLINQQVASAAQLEARMAQKQRDGQRFEMRMRTDSELLDAHRDAMRRMQSRVG